MSKNSGHCAANDAVPGAIDEKPRGRRGAGALRYVSERVANDVVWAMWERQKPGRNSRHTKSVLLSTLDPRITAEMRTDVVLPRLRALIANEALPKQPPGECWANRASGSRTCIACGEGIPEGDLQYESQVNDAPAFLHGACRALWVQEGLALAADVAHGEPR